MILRNGKLKMLTSVVLCFILVSMAVLPSFAVDVNSADSTVDTESEIVSDEDLSEEDICLGLLPDEYDRLVVDEDFSEINGYSSYYDPREDGIITSVKDQYPFGLCLDVCNSLSC